MGRFADLSVESTELPDLLAQIQLLVPLVLILPPLHDMQLSQRIFAVILPSGLLFVPSSTVICVLDVYIGSELPWPSLGEMVTFPLPLEYIMKILDPDMVGP